MAEQEAATFIVKVFAAYGAGAEVDKDLKEYETYEAKLTVADFMKIIAANVGNREALAELCSKILYRIGHLAATLLKVLDKNFNHEEKDFSPDMNMEQLINVLDKSFVVPEGCDPALTFIATAFYHELTEKVLRYKAHIFGKLAANKITPRMAIDAILHIELIVIDASTYMIAEVIDADIYFPALTELLCSEQPGVREAMIEMGYTPEFTITAFGASMTKCPWWSEKNVKSVKNCIEKIKTVFRMTA